MAHWLLRDTDATPETRPPRDPSPTPGPPNVMDCRERCLGQGISPTDVVNFQRCMENCRAEAVDVTVTGEETVVGGESPCEGGYPASESGITVDGSNLVPDDEYGHAGWQRSGAGDWAAHWYYHPSFGLHSSDVARAHAVNGVEPTPNSLVNVCPKGMKQQLSGGIHWCCPGDGATTQPGLGEWNWPDEMSNFYKLLMGRGTDLLGMPLGLTQEEQDAMFGRGFENIRGQEGGMQNDLTNWLSSMGALGTGTELEQRGKISRGIQENISDLMRDLTIYGSERKKSDLLDYTGASQGIFNQGMGYNQLLESINAARRGEGTQALMMLLQLMGLLKY